MRQNGAGEIRADILLPIAAVMLPDLHARGSIATDAAAPPTSAFDPAQRNTSLI